ncbi:MAG: hypothetical protein V9H25_05135 [Candidatus Competibacter sp.]
MSSSCLERHDLLGAAYERLVNSWDRLALFRVLLVGELRKG